MNMPQSQGKLRELHLHFGEEAVNINQKHTNSRCNGPSRESNAHLPALPMRAVSACYLSVCLIIRMVRWSSTDTSAQSEGELFLIYLPARERKSDGEPESGSSVLHTLSNQLRFQKKQSLY